MRRIDFNRRRVHLCTEANAPSPERAGWPARRVVVDGWALDYDPGFERVTLHDAAGRPCATVVGHPFRADRGFLMEADGPVTLDRRVDSLVDLEAAAIADLAGSFVLLAHGPVPPTLYLDPGGSMPIVFDSAARRAALTPEMLFDAAGEYEARFNAELHQHAILDEGVGAWIAGDDTAHHGVRRLLPNHALDLVTWEYRRHWPVADSDMGWLRADDAVPPVTGALRAICHAAARQHKLVAAMTAGKDTRFVLAACREVRGQMELFTIANDASVMDMSIARSVARRFGVRHRTYPIVRADAEQQAWWDRAVGDCVVEHNRVSHPTLERLPPDAMLFSGMYGEVGACRLYREDFAEINTRDIDADVIARRLQLPPHGPTLAAIERWLAPIAHLPSSVVLDLAFWELKFGGWASSQRPAQGAIRLHVMPIAQRAILERFVRLPPEEKRGSAFYERCIGTLWPELMDLPFNRYGDYRDWLEPWRKLTTPGRLRRFLRARLTVQR